MDNNSITLWTEDYTSCNTVSSWPFHFSLADSLTTPVKSLKEAHSDLTTRSHFNNRSDAFSTPSSTPLTPSSWPPRPASTGLRPTCVAGHSCPILIHFWFPFLFVMVVLNHPETIPSPSPLFLPSDPLGSYSEWLWKPNEKWFQFMGIVLNLAYQIARSRISEKSPKFWSEWLTFWDE